jgi:hypothetical protein
VNHDFVGRGVEAFDTASALNLDAELERMSGEHPFELLHLATQLQVGRARKPVGPAGWIDVAVVELNAGEVARRSALL